MSEASSASVRLWHKHVDMCLAFTGPRQAAGVLHLVKIYPLHAPCIYASQVASHMPRCFVTSCKAQAILLRGVESNKVQVSKEQGSRLH